MTLLESILSHYEQPVLTEQDVNEINEQASEHLWNYLCGDGDVSHLYEYNDLMDKIN